MKKRLTTAAKKDNATIMYKAIRDDLCARCEVTASARDYAALIKSLIDVTEKIGRLEGQIPHGNKQIEATPAVLSPLEQAQEKRKLLCVM